MTDLKKELIELQQGYCPVTMQEVESADGDVLYCNGTDYFVSRVGLKFLRDRFGSDFIDKRIVHYPEQGYDVDENDNYYNQD